jgi:8-oxo-dGTP diphosphatase
VGVELVIGWVSALALVSYLVRSSGSAATSLMVSPRGQPVVASASILVDRQDRVLLLRRGPTAPWMPGRWNLPGGNIDPGETPREAAVREAKEEVGVHIQDLSPLSVVEDDGWAAAFFVSRYWSGSAGLMWTNGILENDKMVWASAYDALALDLVPPVRRALEIYFGLRS